MVINWYILSELLDISRAFQNHSEEKVMSAKEVAEFLKLDLNVIYAKCADGQIPHFKMGKLYKFKKSEILEWVKSRTPVRRFQWMIMLGGICRRMC
jgi:excisionase family DNA binding protein